MLENVLLFNIQKSPWTLGALSSFIRLQRLLYFWLKLHFITQQFLLVRVQGLVLPPGAGYPHYMSTLLILTLLVFEGCAIIRA